MPLTNFPGGITSFGVPVMGSGGIPATTGKYVFVDSTTGSNSNDGSSPAVAKATVDNAIGVCTANKGDIIVVMPNHAETVTGIGGVTHDVAGVSVIGLGKGNQRPRFLMDGATTVTWAVSAADAYYENIVLASGHLLVATGFDVTGVRATFVNIEFEDNTTAENWGTPFKATGAANTADGLTIIGCRWVPLVATVNALEFVEVTDDIRNLRIEDNYIAHEGTASPLLLQAGTKIAHGLSIQRNVLSHKMTAGDLAYNNGGATNSGIIANNLIGHANVTAGHELGAVAGCRFFQNYSVSTDALSGLLLPAADVDL